MVKDFYPAGKYMFKINNTITRARCEICSKLTKRHQNDAIRHFERSDVLNVLWRCSGVFIVNFKHISHLVLVFLLLTLNIQLPGGQNKRLFLQKEHHHSYKHALVNWNLISNIIILLQSHQKSQYFGAKNIIHCCHFLCNPFVKRVNQSKEKILRGIFNTLSNIYDGTFHKNTNSRFSWLFLPKKF